MIASDLHPKYDHKERDEILQGFLKHLLDTTPIYFPANVVQAFPKMLQIYFQSRIDLKDPSSSANRTILQRSIDEDLKRFRGLKLKRLKRLRIK